MNYKTEFEKKENIIQTDKNTITLNLFATESSVKKTDDCAIVFQIKNLEIV